MTTQDAAKILALISSSYKREFKELTDEEHKLQIGLWAGAFADVPAEQVAAAVQSYIYNDVTGFAPKIGHIKAILHEAQFSARVDEAQAWKLVSRACANGLYNAKKEFAKLPPEIQMVVGGWEQIKTWAAMPEETVQTTVASRFKKAYRESMGKKKAEEVTPDRVKAIISGIGLALPEVKNG